MELTQESYLLEIMSQRQTSLVLSLMLGEEEGVIAQQQLHRQANSLLAGTASL